MPSDGDHNVDEQKRFLQGRMSAAEAEAFRARVERDPSLAADLAITRALLEAGAGDPNRPPPNDLLWRRISGALEEKTGNARARGAPGKLAFGQMAASAVAAVMLWQLVLAPLFATKPEETEGYALASEEEAGRSVQVTFVPDTREEAIREALLSVGARITDGPSTIGVYRLQFESEAALEAGVETLRGQAGIVETISPPTAR